MQACAVKAPADATCPSPLLPAHSLEQWQGIILVTRITEIVAFQVEEEQKMHPVILTKEEKYC